MLANLTTPLLGLVATAAIGRLGEAPLIGGVALAAIVFDSIYWLLGFLRMGTVALTAQALGAGDPAEQRAVLSRALRRRHCACRQRGAAQLRADRQLLPRRHGDRRRAALRPLGWRARPVGLRACDRACARLGRRFRRRSM